MYRRFITVGVFVILLSLMTIVLCSGCTINEQQKAGTEEAEDLFKDLSGKYFHAQEIAYSSPNFSSRPDPDHIRPYYLDENGVFWTQQPKSLESENPEYEWVEVGKMNQTQLTFENFDACFELDDFIYGDSTVYADDLWDAQSNWDGESESMMKMYREVWKAAGEFRKDTVASWSVSREDGSRPVRSYLIIQEDGSIYIAICFTGNEEEADFREGVMLRLLKVTADETE